MRYKAFHISEPLKLPASAPKGFGLTATRFRTNNLQVFLDTVISFVKRLLPQRE